jgi:hypothetical protein
LSERFSPSDPSGSSTPLDCHGLARRPDWIQAFMNRDLTGKHMHLLDLGVPNSTNSWQFIYMSNMIPISDKLIPFHPEMMIRIDSQ